MAIVKMKRLRLAAVKSQRDELLQKLMLLGCIEISRPEEPAEDDELAGLLSREQAGYSERKSEHETVVWALSLLDKYAPKKKSLLAARPQVDRSIILDNGSVEETLALAKSLDMTDDHIRTIDAQMSHIKGELESLEPWRTMDVPLDTAETSACIVEMGTVPAFVQVKELEKALDAAACACTVSQVSEDGDARYLLLMCLKQDYKNAADAIRSFGWSKASVGEHQGTAAQNIAEMNKELAELEAKKEELTEEIRKAAPHREELKLCADRLLTITGEAEHAERLLYTESSFTFEGWFPAEKEKDLEDLLSRFDCAWETADPTPEEIEESKVPISLKNNPVTKPLTMVTEMYSLPSYNGLDPNPFLMPTFALFFGIMFADIGYGLMLIAAGLVIKYKVHARTTVGYMGGIAIICGIACIIFGAITGTFFGDIIPQVAAFFGGSAAMPLLIDPLKDPMTILVICLGIGIVHMLLAVVINGYLLVRDGKVMDAVWETGSVFLVFIGLALGALGVTWYVAIAGVLAVIIAQGRSSPTIGGKIGGGLYGLYNFATGWFGDILSYCRLMALMLAGTVVAQVFNSLGAMTGKFVLFILIFILGHALNFGLNIIGTYVHTSRLEYLEFFGKWYREGGRAFEPLKINTDYYDILEK